MYQVHHPQGVGGGNRRKKKRRVSLRATVTYKSLSVRTPLISTNTSGAISPYRRNTFTLGHDRYRVKVVIGGDSYPTCWIKALSWRRPFHRSVIAEAWVRSRPGRVKMCCGKRGKGIGASFVSLSGSFHQFLLVFIQTQLLWRGEFSRAREPSDEVL